MIAATRITVGFTESPYLQEGLSFTGPSMWKDFNHTVVYSPGPDLGYYKTDFTVHYADGEEYSGTFDVGSDRPSLGDHIRAFIHGVVDLDDWRPSKETVEKIRHFRDNYEVGE